jgi:YD repeat-containing protein
MAERVALRNSTTTLSFDREGRVIEKILGDDLTKMRYEYDDEGRLKTQIDAEGDRSTMQWSFAPVGPLVVEAVTRDSRGASRRRIAYAEDGRLLSDDTWAAERQVASVRWTYHDVQWPTPVTVPENGLTYVSSGQPRAGQEEHDALGNLIRQKGADGTEVLFDYKFDAQGNWLSRETTRVDSNGARSVIRRERREIHYWDR